MASKRVSIAELANSIGYELADTYPVGWTKPEADNDLRRDIAAAMNVHGWSLDGVPGILPHIRRWTEAGLISPRSRFNGLPPEKPEDVGLDWSLTDQEASRVKIWLLRRIEQDAQVSLQEVEKRIAGRYTLGEAAQEIAKGGGEREEVVLKKLQKAVLEGRLAVYRPGENIQADTAGVRLQPINSGGDLKTYAGGETWVDREFDASLIRTYYEEAYWDDLNKWIEKNEPRISYRFSNPKEMDDETDKSSEGPSSKGDGIPRAQILAHKWPGRVNLDSALSDVGAWNLPARVRPGKKGKHGSALWNPALLAICLASHPNHPVSKAQLKRHIENFYPEWLDEWESKSESL